MTLGRGRAIRDAMLLAAMVGVLPIALVEAQAATITMPKQAAQRAAGAASARVRAQERQGQEAPRRTQAQQGPGAATGVTQSGTPAAGPGAPDPGSRAGGPGAAPDPGNTIMREVFEYSMQGRRDPFYSLLATGDLRPMLSDLRLTTILYDPTGRRPVAVMNDVSTNLQYRVTTGMMLGRMRVTQIRPRKVIFAIDEFGFSRADSLVLADKPQTRQ